MIETKTLKNLSESLLFKGGTVLKLIWRSPRFSEDLDFTGSKISRGGSLPVRQAGAFSA